MNAEQKIKWMILVLHSGWSGTELPEVTTANIDQLYEEADGDDCDLQDARSEVRSGGVETELPCETSRHYESYSVAKQAPDGSWVGWTYWYGGGKHGEPEAMDWMNCAYDLKVTEEQRMTIHRTFTKV